LHIAKVLSAFIGKPEVNRLQVKKPGIDNLIAWRERSTEKAVW
jgi:hypothetical protein